MKFSLKKEMRMSKIKIDLIDVTEDETRPVFDRMWGYLMTFFKCVGIFFFVCFCLGYYVTKYPQTTQCEPTKVVLAKGVFK